MAINRIIVVGAGPSGLLLALLLAKQNIQVDLVEARPTLNEQPRAAHYASPAAYELDRAGVLDDVQALGIKPNSMTWHKPDTTPIASLRLDRMPPERERHSMVVLPSDQLGEILYAHLQRQPSVSVWWSHRVDRVHHDDIGAWIECETPRGPRRLAADYVLGCDGAGSTVRQELFGSEFPGETLNAQLIATNVYYNFTKYAYTDINYVIDPKNFYMAARITSDGLYRVTYADIPGLTPQEYVQRQPMRFQEILPGNPIPSEYYVTNISPYRMHQRCAPEFRVGRVVLAADAAHTCNPFGGLGLTGGIVDAGNLFDALMGIHYRLADDRILDTYNEVRKQIWKEIIDPVSRENFERLLAPDASVAGDNDPFFQDCVKAETDDKLAAKLATSLDVLRHDMTQYYDRRPDRHSKL